MRRRAPRRPGVRRRRRRRPLDRPGQEGRLLHGDQRRGRHRRMHPDECREVREAEQVESARIVGVDQVDFLGLTDGVLEYGVALRRAIAEEVRMHRPDIVITNNFRDSWGGRNLNQADHIATGKATLDAVRDAGNRWIFPRAARRRARAVGRRPRGVVRRLPGRDARRRHHRHLRHRASRRCGRTRPTSTASAGPTSTRPSSSRGCRGPPASGSGPRTPPRSRCSRWAGAPDPGTAASTSNGPREGPVFCSPGWTRTNNPPVNSRMLCQLSYRGSCSGKGSKGHPAPLNRFPVQPDVLPGRRRRPSSAARATSGSAGSRPGSSS